MGERSAARGARMDERRGRETYQSLSRLSRSSRNYRGSRRFDGATNTSRRREGVSSRLRLASVSPSSRLRLTFVDPTRPAWVPPGVLRRPIRRLRIPTCAFSLGAPSPAPPRAFARRLFSRHRVRVSRDPPPPCVRSPSGARYLLPPPAGCLRRLRRPERDIDRDGGGGPTVPAARHPRDRRAVARAPSGHRAERPRGFFAVLPAAPALQMCQATASPPPASPRATRSDPTVGRSAASASTLP